MGEDMKKLLVLASSLLALAATLAPASRADPSQPAKSGRLDLICNGVTVTTVMNGNGIFSPVHDANSTSVFVPTAFDVTLTFTPASGGTPIVDHAIVAKAAHVQGTVTCTIPLQTLLGGSMTIAGTLTGFWTPR